MDSNHSELNRDFLEQQRQRLEELRDELLADNTQAVEEAHDLSQVRDEVQDSGDEGAVEARRDFTDALTANSRQRLGEIRRALEKITAGSYGFSDESGEPIPRARLEAVPEARHTVAEAARRER